MLVVSSILGSGCTSFGPSKPFPASSSTTRSVELDFTWFSFSRDELSAHPTFRKELRVSDEVIQQLIAAGAGEFLAVQKVLCGNGVNASVHVGDEITYPTEFDISENDINVQGGVKGDSLEAQLPGPVIPGAFETREAGLNISVTPLVQPDDETVSVMLIYEDKTISEWEDFGTELVLPGDRTQNIEFRQPVFSGEEVETNVILGRVGAKVVLMQPDAEADVVRVLIMSARF